MTLADIFDRSFSSGAELQTYVSSGQFGVRKKELQKQIDDKKQVYEFALASHMEAHLEAQRKSDEQIKLTLRKIRYT